MAADRGAQVVGIDAAKELIDIAARRTPEGEFRVGDIEALPWADDSFDLVTGFNSFQFANEKERALGEARRVSTGAVAVVIPSRASESGIATVFQQLFSLFPSDVLEALRQSGAFALSEPGKLEESLARAGLTIHEDVELETPIIFDSMETAVRAFVAGGPTQVAIEHSGEKVVVDDLRDALNPFVGDRQVTLPGWYRVVLARS